MWHPHCSLIKHEKMDFLGLHFDPRFHLHRRREAKHSSTGRPARRVAEPAPILAMPDVRSRPRGPQKPGRGLALAGEDSELQLQFIAHGQRTKSDTEGLTTKDCSVPT